MDSFNNIRVGMSTKKSLHITRKLIYNYAHMSGDYNPIHIDEEYASRTKFKRCIAHGGIAINLISNVLGNDLPGYGSVFLKQDIMYVRPVYEGDTIEVCITVKEIIPEKNRILLDTNIVNQQGDNVIEGIALMMLL